eukprot:s712_g21.t1
MISKCLRNDLLRYIFSSKKQHFTGFSLALVGRGTWQQGHFSLMAQFVQLEPSLVKRWRVVLWLKVTGSVYKHQAQPSILSCFMDLNLSDLSGGIFFWSLKV